jgi:hypothetical protein
MDAGIGGAFRILLSAIEGVAVTLGRVVSETITPHITRLQGVFGSIAQCIEMNKNLVRSILKTIAGTPRRGPHYYRSGLRLNSQVWPLGPRVLRLSL